MPISQTSIFWIDYICDGSKIFSFIWRALYDQTIAVHVVERKAHFCVLDFLWFPRCILVPQHNQGEFRGHKNSAQAAHRPWEFFYVLLSLFFTLRTRVMERMSENLTVFSHFHIFFPKYITVSLQSSYLLYKGLTVIC